MIYRAVMIALVVGACAAALLAVTAPRARAEGTLAMFPWHSGDGYALMPPDDIAAEAEKLAAKCGLFERPFPDTHKQEMRCPRQPSIRFEEPETLWMMCGAGAVGCFMRKGYTSMAEDFIYIDTTYFENTEALRMIIVHELAHHLGWKHQ